MKTIHEGRNVKRFREMLGMKQDALAYALGEDWNQQKISTLEQKENVDASILEQVAKILNIPIEAFKSFNEEQAINIINNTIDHGPNLYCNVTFHPVDKLVQLHEEKIALYERMLKEKDEMMARLDKLINAK